MLEGYNIRLLWGCWLLVGQASLSDILLCMWSAGLCPPNEKELGEASRRMLRALIMQHSNVTEWDQAPGMGLRQAHFMAPVHLPLQHRAANASLAQLRVSCYLLLVAVDLLLARSDAVHGHAVHYVVQYSVASSCDHFLHVWLLLLPQVQLSCSCSSSHLRAACQPHLRATWQSERSTST